MLRRVAAPAASLLLMLLSACDGTTAVPNIVVPGFGLPGANRPPLFASYALHQLSTRRLQLLAGAIDLDGDGLIISYQQLAGPLAVERSSVRIGGNLDIEFDIPSDGTYVFRVTASDGFFTADVFLTPVVITPGPAPIDPVTLVGVSGATNPLVGRFRVNITGQTADLAGNLSFSLPAVVSIDPLPPAYVGSNQVVLRIDTDVAPSSLASTLGALQLSSLATRAGKPADAFALVLNGPRVDFAADVLAPGAAGVFRPGSVANGAVLTARVAGFVAVNADTLTGIVDLRDNTGVATYRAQLSGTRVR
ncbi:MAG: hypothetical protein U1A27_13140 [Phycisphaerae bacterium]